MIWPKPMPCAVFELCHTHDVAEALKDYGQSIAIMERLRTQPGEHWLPVYEDLLRNVRKLQDDAASLTK